MVSLLLPLAVPDSALAAKFATKAANPVTVEATPTEATLVFFRPSGYGGGKPVIVDGEGQIIGQMYGKTRFLHRVPAGEHTFTVWGEATPTLHATVEAGEIYYIKMDVSVGAWTARYPLVAMGPSREGWDKMSEWLKRSDPWQLVPDQTEKYRRARADDITVVLEKGETSWGTYDDERKKNRSITADDGVTQPVQ